MSTEADKTNTAVIATMLALGAAAMLGGSAALVALARGEVQEYSEASDGFADLETVAMLEAEHRRHLAEAKLPLSKAQAMVLADIQKDPSAASPAVAPAEPIEGDAGAGDAGAPEPSGEAVDEGAAHEETPVGTPRPTAAPDSNAPPKGPGTAPKQPAPVAPGATQGTPHQHH